MRVLLIVGLLWLPLAAQSFDVSTIKDAVPDRRGGGANSSDSISLYGVTLQELIQIAHRSELRIRGGPDWMTKRRFDVEAKSLSGPLTPEQTAAMLRNLLAERFALKTRTEMEGVSVWMLNLAHDDGRLGPGLRKSSACEGPGCAGRIFPDHIEYRGANLTQLATLLGSPMFQLGRPVVDNTGLQGTFDIDLKFDLRAMTKGEQNQEDPSFVTALREQLGLRLRSGKAELPIMIVESAALPDEN